MQSIAPLPLKALGAGRETGKTDVLPRDGSKRRPNPGSPLRPGMLGGLRATPTGGPGELFRASYLILPSMPSLPWDRVELEAGEHGLSSWRGEPVRPGGDVDRPGWLVLTDRRLLFFRQSGLWRSGRLEQPPRFARRLEEIRSVGHQRLWMRIGYGDRFEAEGIAIDGWAVRLDRNTPARVLLEEIDGARRARRTALGLPPP